MDNTLNENDNSLTFKISKGWVIFFYFLSITLFNYLFQFIYLYYIFKHSAQWAGVQKYSTFSTFLGSESTLAISRHGFLILILIPLVSFMLLLLFFDKNRRLRHFLLPSFDSFFFVVCGFEYSILLSFVNNGFGDIGLLHLVLYPLPFFLFFLLTIYIALNRETVVRKRISYFLLFFNIILSLIFLLVFLFAGIHGF